MVLLKFLFVFYAIYYLIKLIFRNFIRKITSGFENTANSESNNSFYKEDAKPEGEVTIQNAKKKEKKLDENIGEYTDFEDID